jgi:hypothetical protein
MYSTKSTANPRKKFYISNTKMSWTDSRAFCKSHGMDLITLGSAREVINLVRIKNSTARIWTGITDLNQEGVFKNYNDNLTNVRAFLAWADNEPNNLGKLEHCVELSGSKFNDYICGSEHSPTVYAACELKFQKP